jgi:hypothetical protein
VQHPCKGMAGMVGTAMEVAEVVEAAVGASGAVGGGGGGGVDAFIAQAVENEVVRHILTGSGWLVHTLTSASVDASGLST